MEYKDIKKLMDDMGNSKLNSIKIEFPDGTKIKMEKDNSIKRAKEKEVVIEDEDDVKVEKGKNEEVENNNTSIENKKYITSPMVGTFYSKPSPDAKPFVEVGSKVKKGDKLCIIEAMKLMNEIEAEEDGEIVEILVKDEEMVDYGKKLFVIK